MSRGVRGVRSTEDCGLRTPRGPSGIDQSEGTRPPAIGEQLGGAARGEWCKLTRANRAADRFICEHIRNLTRLDVVLFEQCVPAGPPAAVEVEIDAGARWGRCQSRELLRELQVLDQKRDRFEAREHPSRDRWKRAHLDAWSDQTLDRGGECAGAADGAAGPGQTLWASIAPFAARAPIGARLRKPPAD